MNTPPPEQQNRRSTRSALAEIPTRLGMLSVSENGRLPSVTAIGITILLPCSCFQDILVLHEFKTILDFSNA
jgi:hypothetical protein